MLTRKVWSQNYDESSDDSDDYIITMKEANEKLHNKQREIDSLNRRLKRLEELEEMNLFWQRKYATEGSPDRPSSSLSVKRNLFQEVGLKIIIFIETYITSIHVLMPFTQFFPHIFSYCT